MAIQWRAMSGRRAIDTAKGAFSAPAPPYTAALAGAAPAPLEGSGPHAAPRMAGEPRSPVDPAPDACRFHDPGPMRQDLCRTVRPPLRPMPNGRRVACHLPAGAAA